MKPALPASLALLSATIALIVAGRIAATAALPPKPAEQPAAGRMLESDTQTEQPTPPAECLRRQAVGEPPCSEAEERAEAEAWNQYYGCHPQGCGHIDFDAQPELIGRALVLEPIPQ